MSPDIATLSKHGAQDLEKEIPKDRNPDGIKDIDPRRGFFFVGGEFVDDNEQSIK